MIQEDLEKIRLQAKEALENAKTSEDINRIRVDILGKKGALTGILRGMKDVSKEDRPKVGQMSMMSARKSRPGSKKRRKR